MAFIEVSNVTKDFKIVKREKGFKNSIKSFIKPAYEIKRAVDNVSFNINKGELVGYIGVNGAGKSTTIKMLSGILYPTSGEIIVDGRVPHENRKENAKKIGVVFGQRSQLYWDLPMEETFDIYKKMYKIDETRFKRNVDFYVELLGMKEFLRRPTRQLSLGQKMRANLAIALLHEPDIVYLDEPTIGLDVIAKSKIRKFIREVNKEKNTTLILTTHDMDDIEEICNRIIMIDKGRILYDGSLGAFKNKYSKGTVLTVEFGNEDVIIEDSRLTVFKEEGPKKHILFRKEEIAIAEVINYLSKTNKILDLSLKEPNIEEIIKDIYK